MSDEKSTSSSSSSSTSSLGKIQKKPTVLKEEVADFFNQLSESLEIKFAELSEEIASLRRLVESKQPTVVLSGIFMGSRFICWSLISHVFLFFLGAAGGYKRGYGGYKRGGGDYCPRGTGRGFPRF